MTMSLPSKFVCEYGWNEQRVCAEKLCEASNCVLEFADDVGVCWNEDKIETVCIC